MSWYWLSERDSIKRRLKIFSDLLNSMTDMNTQKITSSIVISANHCSVCDFEAYKNRVGPKIYRRDDRFQDGDICALCDLPIYTDKGIDGLLRIHFFPVHPDSDQVYWVRHIHC